VARRDGGAWETTRRKGLFRRLTLRRADGQVYLDRWAVGHDRVGGIMLHRMSAPDPGVDLHDHPWWFLSVVLWGGYTEERADTRAAPAMAQLAEHGVPTRRPWGSARTMRLDECHRVVALDRRTCWTLVVKGPRRRPWGFYLPTGYMPEPQYDAEVRSQRRDLWSDQNAANRPWRDN
jgi:hypothetical protein